MASFFKNWLAVLKSIRTCSVAGRICLWTRQYYKHRQITFELLVGCYYDFDGCD